MEPQPKPQPAEDFRTGVDTHAGTVARDTARATAQRPPMPSGRRPPLPGRGGRGDRGGRGGSGGRGGNPYNVAAPAAAKKIMSD